MATGTQPKSDLEVLEQGNLYFLYRPKVEQETVHSTEDIQRIHMVIGPHGRQWFRLITLGKKSLPDLQTDNQQGWCFVETVTDSAKALEAGLRREVYETKTRGDRTQPAVRPVGEGVYQLVVDDDGQTRLVYALELPHDLGPAQQALNINQTGNYVISIKNPEQPSPEGLGFQQGDRTADFPQDLQDEFRERTFIAANPPHFLDYVGAEILLISTASEDAQNIGGQLQPQAEDETTSEAINKLRMRKTRHPLEPLLTGELT
ncbi:hypothetical protein [Leptolyngbya iicbica]|uniref:Uncharacterized protein n=2 Tax=Cyanophyceae TaxID=3028117 RepID=A0A4V2E2I7_9CYAN|nr:hypothetical protein [Leptolyngbya sp. LK]RZM78696.1 hypothetical protein DYY88_07790 [Leptolyngbya sp. LK]